MIDFKGTKIKVCHFVSHITGREDGVFTHILLQIKLLDKEKIEQIIVCQKNEFIESILKEFNVKYYFLENLERKYSFFVLFQFMKIIISENIRVINVHNIKTYLIAGLANIFLRRKLIYNFHGSFIDNDYNTKFEKLVYRFFHYIICLFNEVNVLVPSQRSKLLLMNESRIFKKIDYYYNGFAKLYEECHNDYSLAYELESLKEKYFIIGFVGRLNREKNVFRALRIYEELKKINENVFFVIMGSGEEEARLKEFVMQNSINSVKIYGYIKNAFLYMKYFNMLLITSNSEGLPFVVWEAMYNKVPIVSTDVGGIKEILLTENCGFIFEQDDIHEAIKQIILLMNNKSLCDKLGNNGYKAIIEKYNANNFKNFFEKYYHDLINEKEN